MIDFDSVLLTSVVLAFALLVLSCFTWLGSRRQIAGPGYWFAGFSLIAAGIGLYALGDRAPGFVSIVLANGLVIAGVMLKTLGFVRFLGAEPKGLSFALAGVLATSTAAVFIADALADALAGALDAVGIATGLAYACYGIVTAYFLVFRAPRELRAETRFAASLFVAYAGIYAFRIVFTLRSLTDARWAATVDTVDVFVLVAAITLLACIAIIEMQLMHSSLRFSLRRASEAMAVANQSLTEEILRRTVAENQLLAINRELSSTQKEIMITLSEVVEFRSKETALHVARVGEYARSLCKARGLAPDEAELIADAAPMHDIGKISISDDILNKPAPLTGEEMAAMRAHTLVGFNLLDKSERPLIKMAALIALEHHEYWNGSGYPYGKRGEEISFAGRVVCLCDVFDALSSFRPYKDAWELPRILEYIRAERGGMFDPELVDSLFLRLDEFISITESLRDEASS
ncbi:MAG: HD domain-containing protein [Spirochaetes bacterium]|nr:HD domain-containing protein [Spirochaetota bacterium]MBU1080289.1 HD domain-containing protein [Spirochaetota bacterium]